jgi:RHS repeat-associated protein
VTSDATMNVAQWFDYAPYGSVIATTNTGATNAGRQYIGQYTDDSGLSYLNARFYNSRQGQFITEDPVFWQVGLSQDGENALVNPQAMNSYAYANDNPVTMKDPSGKFIWLALPIIFLGYDALQSLVDYYDYRNMNVTYNDFTTPEQKTETKVKLGFDAITLATGQGLERAGLQISSLALDPMFAAKDAYDTRASNPLYNFFEQGHSGGGSTGQMPMVNFGVSNFGAAMSNVFSNSIQARIDATKSINSSTGNSSSSSGGSGPSNNSLWVTPSGAVVTFGGQLVAPPPSHH